MTFTICHGNCSGSECDAASLPLHPVGARGVMGYTVPHRHAEGTNRDPVTLTLIATGLSVGLGKAFEKILEKGVIDPALDKGLEPLRAWLTRGYEKKKEEEKLVKAIEAALTASTGTPDRDQWATYRWVTALDEIKAKPELAARAAAATIEMVRDDADNVPPDLLAALKISDQRQPFARFLFALRGQLIGLPGIGEGIRYANEMHKIDRLNGLYELVTAAASAEFAGTAIWVRVAPPDARQLELPYLETMVADLNRLSLEGRARGEGQAGRASLDVFQRTQRRSGS